MWWPWAIAMLAWLTGVASHQVSGQSFWQVNHEQRHWMGLVLASLGMGVAWRADAWARRAHLAWPVQAFAVVAFSAGVACLGWSHVQWAASQRLQMQWPDFLDNQEVTVIGQVDSMPSTAHWGQRFEVKLREVHHRDSRWVAGQDWQQAPGRCPERVALTWSRRGHDLAIEAGQVWRWTVRLRVPHGRLNPGGFDAEQWLFFQGIRAEGKVVLPRQSRRAVAMGAEGALQDSVVRPVLLHAPVGTDHGWLDRHRTRLANRLQRALPDSPQTGLMIGLTLGQQSAIPDEDWQTLRETGIAHLAAISGLHITMMGWLCGALASWCWRRSRRAMGLMPAVTVSRWACLMGAWGYALMAGWGVPAQRTVIMLALVLGLQLRGKRWPWPLIVLMAAVAVTFLDPWALSQPSFWLSFVAVSLLMVAGNPSDELQHHDAQAGHPSWVSRFWMFGRTQWLAAWGLAPLSMVFFQGVALMGLIANLMCVPLFTLVIAPLALLGFLWAALWPVCAWLLSYTMSVLNAWLRQPDFWWQLPEVHPWAYLLAFAGVLLMLMPWPWQWRCMALPTCLFLYWPTPLSMKWPAPAHGHVQIVAPDVGQGTAVLVRTSSHTLLYDTGPRYTETADAADQVLLGLFRAMNIRHLDMLMISHDDLDHVGGAQTLQRLLPIRHWRTSLPADHPLFSDPRLEAVDRPARGPGPGPGPSHDACQTGQHWTWDGVTFRVWHPNPGVINADQSTPDNAKSCVLTVTAQGRTVLLSGDIESAQEAQMVEQHGMALRSEVLIVPHHGSKTSSTTAFLAAVQPKMALVQAGIHNRYGHPHETVVRRYRSLGVQWLPSTWCGAWIWQSNAPRGQCWRQTASRYWHTPIPLEAD